MYKIFKTILTIVWILDICNFPQVEFLDTSFPINGLAWFLFWVLVPPFREDVNIYVNNNVDEE